MDLEDQLRRHYEQQQLSADRVRNLVAAGRAAALGRQHRKWWGLMVAAIVVVGLGMLAGVRHFHRAEEKAPSALVAQDLANAVTGFFAQHEPALGLVAPDRRVLVEWLRQRGGPGDFQPPPAMAGLATYGCQVLNVRGVNVYLICFVANASGDRAKDAPPALVHLVLAPSGKVAVNALTVRRASLPDQGDWHFSTWLQDGLLIVAATTLPADRLAGLVGG